MKNCTAFLLLFATISLVASVYELTFDKHPFPGKWWMPDQASFDAKGGESGTGSLRISRKKSDPFKTATHQLKLKKGTVYKVKCAIFCDFENHAGPVICVEYHKNGKHLSGNYCRAYVRNKALYKNGKWRELEFDLKTPKDFDKAILRFYLGRAAEGSIWFDNVRIEETGAVPPDMFDISPSNLTFTALPVEVAFKPVFYQQVSPKDYYMQITANGKTYKTESDSDGVFKQKLDISDCGKITVNTKLTDRKNGKVSVERDYNYFVASPDVKTPANASRIREDGVAIVDGKPFLPIGFFVSKQFTDLIAGRIAESGANMVMNYYIHYKYNLDNAFKLAQKHDLKLLFCTIYQHETSKSRVKAYNGAKGIDNVLRAWAEKFSSHPSFLGWYVSDENPREQVPRIRKIREILNEVDPHHFSVTLTYRGVDFPEYVNTGDVLVPDVYPIETTQSNSMGGIYSTVSRAKALTPRVWFVPQSFSWGTFRKQANPKYPYRFPTEKEMRSMTLSGAVAGAKGFIFYNYTNKWREKVLTEDARKEWNNVVNAIQILKQLEPYLLSSEKFPEIKCGNTNIHAAGFKHNGKCVVAVVSDGPGAQEGVFHVPGYPDLKSRFGNTENLGGGKYRFKGADIDSDILE